MNFFRQDTAIIGSYYYNNKKIPLEFTFNSHIDTSGNVYIEEGYFNQDNELIKTGMFIGRFINDRQIKGKWMKPDSSASYDFTLNESYDRGSSEFDIVHQEKSYGRCESGPCCFISYSYPKIVKFPNEDIESDLNKLFHDNVFKSFTEMPGIDSGKKYSHLEQIMDDFINSYKNDVENQKDIYKDWNPVWFFNKNILVDHNFNGIVSLTNVVDQFLGGAHPTAYIELLSIDMKKGKIIKLDDILKPGYKKNLTAIAEKIFRKSWKLAPNADLDTAGFFLENNKFYLNDNFYIQPNGLKFKFNQYEIAPYALGSPEIIIPYGQLKDLIRPDGVLNNLESDKF
jgi:hypothetical protein